MRVLDIDLISSFRMSARSHPLATARLHRNMSPLSRIMEGLNGPEPTIPFRVYKDYHTFCTNECYDFVSLAHSTRYAPKEADALIRVIGEYMTAV